MAGRLAQPGAGACLVQEQERELNPARHACFSESPFRPRMSICSSGPLIASKPVAKTMTSSSCSASLVLTPLGVMPVIGVARRSTSETFSRLNVSK
jgi:hypothetical protein